MDNLIVCLAMYLCHCPVLLPEGLNLQVYCTSKFAKLERDAFY